MDCVPIDMQVLTFVFKVLIMSKILKPNIDFLSRTVVLNEFLHYLGCGFVSFMFEF